MTKKTVGWSIKKFLKWKRASEVAPATYKHYVSRMRVVLGPIASVKLKKLTRQKLLAQIAAADEGRRRATQSSTRRALSNWQKWLLLEDHIPERLLKPDDLRSKGFDRRKRYATDEENRLILASSRRDFVVFYTCMLATGARPKELADAKIHELRVDDGRMTLIPTNHKTIRYGNERMIPIPDVIIPLVQESIGDRNEGHIFLRANGRPWIDGAATTRFRTARRKHGIPEHIKMYLARHAFLTKVAKERGATVAAALGGHNSTAMIERHYLLLGPQDMHDMIEKPIATDDSPAAAG